MSAGQTVEIHLLRVSHSRFLGINMKCASCHDSFIDRWKLQEAMAWQRSTQLSLWKSIVATSRSTAATAAWLFPELGQVDPGAAREERLKQLAGLMTHPSNGRFSRTIVNRLWYKLMGRGIVHPLDAMQSPPWNEDLWMFWRTR